MFFKNVFFKDVQSTNVGNVAELNVILDRLVRIRDKGLLDTESGKREVQWLKERYTSTGTLGAGMLTQAGKRAPARERKLASRKLKADWIKTLA